MSSYRGRACADRRGFRIPDIMRESGARLVETGTTNITELADYRDAINDGTAMIFSVHRLISGWKDLPAGRR